MNPATAQRHTADERREDILAVAQELFAQKGLYGTSTDEIARRAGISQPYLFRLFGTKKELFLATVQRCMDETLEMFRVASAGKSGEAALEAIGDAYYETVITTPQRLQAQMQAYAASGDADVRKVVKQGYGRLVEHAEAVSGFPPDVISAVFAKGMLMNVIGAMQLQKSEAGWAGRLLEGCRHTD